MPVKIDELHQIKLDLAVLAENSKFQNMKLDDIRATIDKYTKDYEDRLRRGEESRAKLSLDISALNDRMKTFNLIQGSLTALAAIITYWFSTQ